MGEVLCYVIGMIIFVVMVVYFINNPRSAKGPMYVRYLKTDGSFMERPQLKPDEIYNHSSVCPICRFHFRTDDCFDVICRDCWHEIQSYSNDFRPSFITDELDWLYLKNHKHGNFWIIFYDHKHGDIDADQARRLMHQLVPEDFGKIEPFRYRESRYDYFTKHYQNHFSGGPIEYCSVCGGSISEGRCSCYHNYTQDMETGGKSFVELQPYFTRLRELSPKVAVDGYFRKYGQIFPRLKQCNGFKPEDYITFDDWQVIRYIMTRSQYEEYTEQIILTARQRYINLIKTDLELLINYHEAVVRGEKPDFPLLPSTNPTKIAEIPKGKKTTTDLYDKLMNEFYPQ